MLSDEESMSMLEKIRTPFKWQRLVLEPSYTPSAFDSLAVDAPFVFSHDGRYYMTFIGYDGIGYRTGLAVSDDLLEWTKERVIVDRGPKGSFNEFNGALTWILRENELFGSGQIRKVRGRFLGTYHAYPRAGYEEGPAVIGLCRSGNLRSWELEEPALCASDSNASEWERGGLYKSCILQHRGRYYLFYNAKDTPENWVEQIGVATSSDLQHWTRYAGNPIISVGSPGRFDDRFCSDPYVVRHGEVWLMFFYTLSSDGKARDTVAFSRDLLHWEKSNEILIEPGPPGSIDARYAHKPSVFVKGGTFYHFYCAVSPDERKIGDLDLSECRGIAVAASRPVGPST
ncbi:MAG: hypothetical protein HY706_11760 [Candidatus Hydrogenedentes bacterium]|nr:hypothetical protein [Candidatus Hydrogenedentota bacterium]